MSFIRMGYPLNYFEGESKSYVFPSSYKGKDYVEDYEDKYDDNATFAELLVTFVYRETKDKEYAWKIAGILEKKIRGIKRRKKPLSEKEFSKWFSENVLKKQKNLSKPGIQCAIASEDALAKYWPSDEDNKARDYLSKDSSKKRLLKLANRLASNDMLTKKDVENFSKKIKAKAAKRFRK